MEITFIQQLNNLKPTDYNKVTTINLSGNNLTTLPDSIGSLVNLQTLDLSENNLTTLPDCIGS